MSGRDNPDKKYDDENFSGVTIEPQGGKDNNNKTNNNNKNNKGNKSTQNSEGNESNVFTNLINQIISSEDRNKVGKGGAFDLKSKKAYKKNPDNKHQGNDIKALINPNTGKPYDDINFISPFEEAFYVTKASDGDYGNYVLLYEISDGKVTGNTMLIAHLKSFNSDLKSWSKISKGTNLGSMGNTGQCIPPSYIHGHVELWINQQKMLKPNRVTDVVKKIGPLQLW